MLISFLITACTQQVETKKLPQDGFTSRIDTSGIMLTARYAGTSVVDESKKIADRIPVYHHQFQFLIDVKDTARLRGIKQAYLDFDIQQDFSLEIPDGRMSAVICQRIPNGIRSNMSYIIVFENNDSLQNKVNFFYNDQTFGLGEQKFSFSIEKNK